MSQSNAAASPQTPASTVEWSAPLTNNSNGGWRPEQPFRNGPVASLRIEAREQKGYGLVNFRVGMQIPNSHTYEFTHWATFNHNGSVSVLFVDVADFDEVCVREQNRYGIVNFGVKKKNSSDIEWMFSNEEGEVKSASVEGILSGFQCKEQDGYGLIDMKFRTGVVESPWGRWMTENPNGAEQGAHYVPAGFQLTEIEGMEQGGYGLVNLRLVFTDPSGFRIEGPWATRNFSGTKRSLTNLPLDIQGLAVREQNGYGLVNLAVCQSGCDNPLWMTQNESGSVITGYLPVGISGLQCREEDGRGLVDLRALSTRC